MQDDRRGAGGRPGRRPRADERGARRDFGDRDRGARRDFPREQPHTTGPRPYGGDRPYPSDRPYAGDRRDRGSGRPEPGHSAPRPTFDEGGMAIRLDPRRLSLLKQLAGEAGLRPGELVTQWIEGRLDAERSGTVRVAGSVSPDAVAALSQRLDDLARRVDQLSTTPSEALGAAAASEPVAGTKRTRRAAASGKRASSTRGRRASANPRSKSATRRVPLHEEIASVISESGPMSAAQIAQAIVGRGRYTAPRSARPLDAATVNSRISNPTYRSRFRREDGKIGLAQEA